MKYLKKNNKGFTLIELLAVIAILVTITMIAIPSITASLERNKEKINTNKKTLLTSAAEIYVTNNKNVVYNIVTSSGSTCYIALSELDVTEETKKDADGKEFTGCILFTRGSTTTADTYAYVTACSTPTC